MGQHQSRPLCLLNHLGNRIRLTSARCPQQSLEPKPLIQPLGQLRNRLRLVTGRPKFRNYFKFWHIFSVLRRPDFCFCTL